jgi:integrase
MYPARVTFAEAAATGRLYTVAKPRWRDDRQKWSVKFRDPVTGRERQKLFKAERQAWAFYNRVEDDTEALRSGSLSIRQVAVGARGLTPLSDIIAAYETDMKARRISAAHVKTTKSLLERAAAKQMWKVMRDVDAASTLQFLSGFSAATANDYLRVLRAFIPDDALVDIQRMRADPIRPCRAFTVEEFTRLTAIVQPRKGAKGPTYRGKVDPARRLYYLLAGRTGLRHSEPRRLRWEHIDFDHAAIVLPAKDQKSGRADLLPVLPSLLEELRAVRQAPAAKVVRATPNKRTFYEDLKRAGIAKKNDRGTLYLRSLRMTLGTHLALNGVDLRVTQRLMRHSDPKLTTKLYTDAALLPLRGGIASLDPAPQATKEETA